jgi:hypothetical protein
MKNKLHFLLLTLFIAGISFSAFSQARKYVMIEHFTQASCSPCAQQNPVLQALLNTNRGSIHHIAYHTSWPGVDPMNAYNAPQVADRVSYYGVSGVPDCFMLGNQFHGGPASFTQSMINNAATDPAPIRVLVKETSNGVTRTVHVKVVTLDTVPAANYKIRVGVEEQWIHYTTPPGSNGEKDFPDVFRKMIPSSTGDDFTPAAIGDTASFTYTYTLDITHWDTTKIYTIAFIQNETTKEIINSGSSFDPGWELAPLGKPFVAGIPGDVKTFDYNLFNFTAFDDNFTVKVLSNHPSDWSTQFEINGTTYMDSVNILIPANSFVVMHVNVTLGDDAGLGNYTISMKSVSNTNFDAQQLNAYIISQVHEIVINNDGAWGDNAGTYSPQDFQHIYTSALAYAGNTNYYAVTTIGALEKGYMNNALGTVWNYYFNISWTFPALTDQSVACLKSELDAGKNLFISGQDVGWDVYTTPANGGHGDATIQSFYNNYMDAIWLNDGSTSDNQLYANPTDSVFGSVNHSALSMVYGSTYFFPDEIQLKDASFGDEIFYYNTAHNKLAGVRATNGTWKVVYMAPAPEMISDTLVAREIIKIAHDWFGGSTTGIKENNTTGASLDQNIPNPSNNNTMIQFNLTSNEYISLDLYDINGRIINHLLGGMNLKGLHRVTVNTSALNAGVYYYALQTPAGKLTKKMIVVK